MRYVVKKPKAFDVEDWDDDSVPHVPDLTVYDSDEFVFTGILDHEGNEIHRADKAPLGFLAEILE
jgi:hypothetical protein